MAAGANVIEVGGNKYKLRFDMNALCDIERELQSDLATVVTELQELVQDKRMRLDLVRVLLFAGMKKYNRRATTMLAGDIIERALEDDVVDSVMEGLLTALMSSGLFKAMKAKADEAPAEEAEEPESEAGAEGNEMEADEEPEGD